MKMSARAEPTKMKNLFWVCWILLSYTSTAFGECFIISEVLNCHVEAQCTSTFELQSSSYNQYRGSNCRIYNSQRYYSERYEKFHVHIELNDFTNEFELPEYFFNYNDIESVKASGNEWWYIPTTIKLLKNHLQILELSHCRFNSVSLSDISEYSNLNKLDLSNNYISSLGDVNTSSLPNRHLNILMLSYNEIVDVSLVLNPLVALTELYLDHNRIIVIDERTFENMKDLVVLFINDNLIAKLDPRAFLQIMSLTSFDASNNQITLKLTETVFQNNTNLKKIDLSNNYISIFKKKCFQNMNISLFKINNNQLEGSLTKGLLNGLNEITSLDFSYNRLVAIQNLAFVATIYLKALHLDHNNITDIEIYAFSSLHHLEKLDLSHNNVSRLNFDKTDLSQLSWLSLKLNSLSVLANNTFHDLTSLTFLDLSFNNIKHIRTKMFQFSPKLIQLSIEANDLEGEVVNGTLDGLQSLLTLDLSQAHFASFKNYSFHDLRSLQSLNASRCNITEIEYNTFSAPMVMLELDISHNFLTSFLLNFTNINALEIINLKNNFITYLKDETFSQLINLKEFTVAHNNITLIENLDFRNNPNLQNIDLSYNTYLHSQSKYIGGVVSINSISLNGVPHMSFKEVTLSSINEMNLEGSQIRNVSSLYLSNIKSLQALDLHSNIISVLHKNDWSKLFELITLDLSKNIIKIIEPSTFNNTTHLKNLNLSANRISALTFGSFKGLINLEKLDLSSNLLNVLNVHNLYDLPRLVYLIIDENSINKLDVSGFINSNLKEISIGGNMLSCNKLVTLKSHNEGLSFRLTARVLNYHEENVDGITCREFKNNDEGILQANASFVENNINFMSKLAQDVNEIKEKVNDITLNGTQNISFLDNNNALYNFSTILSIYFSKQLELQSNLSKVFIDELKNDRSVLNEINAKYKFFSNSQNVIRNETIKITNNDNNVILSDILKAFHNINKPNKNDSNEKNINDDIKKMFFEEKEKIIETMKQDLKTFLNEKKGDIASATDTHNDSVSIPVATAESPQSENLKSKSSSGKFIEICLGFILVIMLFKIFYHLYITYYVRSPRSGTQQPFSTNLEMQE